MGKVDENKKKKKEALFNTAYELFTTNGRLALRPDYGRGFGWRFL